MQEQPRSVYRSMQGKEVDMNKLINQNEMTVAIGNARVNARGDELGPGGKIIKKREDNLNKSSIPNQVHSRTATTQTNTQSIADLTHSINVRKKIQTKTTEGDE